MNEQQFQRADRLLTDELAAKRTAREDLKRDLERLETAARQRQHASPPEPRRADEERPPWLKH